MSTSKKKNLGQGMKPRGNQAETEKAEEPVSADEGQEETSVEAVSEAQGVEQTPNNLEPVIDGQWEDPRVAASMPDGHVFQTKEAVSVPSDDLRKLLYDSGEGEPEMQQLPEETVRHSRGSDNRDRLQYAEESKKLLTADALRAFWHREDCVEFAETKSDPEKSDAQKAAETLLVQNLDKFPTAEDLAKYPLYRFDPNTGTKEAVVERVEATDDGLALYMREPKPDEVLYRGMPRVQTLDYLGQQSDGTFKLVLSVDEGYIESIKQEAESNGMTAEQWCSQQFNFFLESWWAKPKGR